MQASVSSAKEASASMRCSRPKILSSKAVGSEIAESASKLFEMGGAQSQAGGLPVSSKLGEQIGHAFKRLEQMKGRDTAA